MAPPQSPSAIHPTLAGFEYESDRGTSTSPEPRVVAAIASGIAEDLKIGSSIGRDRGTETPAECLVDLTGEPSARAVIQMSG